MKYFYRYLPLSDEVRQNSLYVLAGGYTLIPPRSPYPPMPHPADHHFQWQQGRTLREYQIIYISRGGGVFESQSGGEIRVEAGTLFMLFPEEWHRYSPDPETGWDEYWIAFQGRDAGPLAAEYSLSPASPTINAPASDTLIAEFIRVADEMRGEAIGYQKIIATRTMLILATAFALSERKSYEGSDILPVIEKAKSLLSDRMDQNINMEELATDLRIGYSLFRKAFRQYTGFSPAQYHLELRINHAGNLLSMTTIPIALVGQRIGFDAPGYFCRIFKNKTGYTPGEFRTMTQSR